MVSNMRQALAAQRNPQQPAPDGAPAVNGSTGKPSLAAVARAGLQGRNAAPPAPATAGLKTKLGA